MTYLTQFWSNKKAFLLLSLMLLFSSFLKGEDKVIYGVPGESTSTITIPKAYAGKEGQIVFIVSGVNTYIGEAYTPSEKLYSYMGPKTSQAQINILSQSKSTYVSSLEHGTYTFTAGYLYNGELIVSPLGRIASVSITIIGVDANTPTEKDENQEEEKEEEENNDNCHCHCCCCCNCNKDSDASLLLIDSLYTCISNLQKTMNEEDTKIKDSLNSYVTHLETAIASGNSQLKSYLTSQLQNLHDIHTLDIKELRERIANEIKYLESTISNLNNKLSALEKDFAITAKDLQHAIANNSSNISLLQTKLQEQFNQLTKENNSVSKELLATIEEKELLYNNKLKELTKKYEEDLTALSALHLNDKTTFEQQLNNLSKDFQSNIEKLKVDHQKSISSLENTLQQLDSKFTLQLKEYTNLLRLEANENNTLLQEQITAQEKFLTNSLNDFLQKKLTLIEKEITNTQKKINALSSTQVLDINSQLAILKENKAQEITLIEEKYASLLKEPNLTASKKALLEGEKSSKIAAILVKYAKEENLLQQTLRELTTNVPSSVLLDNLAKLSNLKEKTLAALNSASLEEKVSILTSISEYFNKVKDDNLEEKLIFLQAQLNAIDKLHNLSIEEVIEQIKLSNLTNNVNLEDLKLVLTSYVNQVKNDLSTQINAMTLLIEETQKALNKRMDNLEDRLRYFLLPEDELQKLLIDSQNKIQNLSSLIAQKTSQIKTLKESNSDTSLLEEELHLLTLQYEEAQEKQNNLAFVVNLRENSELALHKKWIIELQSLTSNLEKQVFSNEKTIKEQTKEITTLKDSLSNLEKAFNLELKALEEKLFLALEKNDNQSKQEIEDLKNKIATLSDNVKSIANNPYFAGSSSNGFFNNRFGGSNSNIPVDDRDLRTDVNSNLLF